MPKNVVCKKCNNLINGWCEKVIDSPDPDMVRDCRHFWEKTNADRIRAMSDEELAVFVRGVIMAEDCPVAGADCDKCFFKEPCFNGSKWHGKETEWLKQTADEDFREAKRIEH